MPPSLATYPGYRFPAEVIQHADIVTLMSSMARSPARSSARRITP
ncbi:hypothetical protein ACFQX4_28000 [Roseomonas sp. GCM10028921]